LNDLESIQARMRQDLAKKGALIAEVYYCPHTSAPCGCRKPAPGLLLKAAREHGIDLKESWLIGDSTVTFRQAEMQGAKRCGLKTAKERESASRICLPRRFQMPSGRF